jgi:hypothetical protein
MTDHRLILLFEDTIIHYLVYFWVFARWPTRLALALPLLDLRCVSHLLAATGGLVLRTLLDAFEQAWSADVIHALLGREDALMVEGAPSFLLSGPAALTSRTGNPTRIQCLSRTHRTTGSHAGWDEAT